MTHTQSEDTMTGGWKTVRLGELITIKHGFAFKGEYITTEDNGIVLVTPGNFAIGGGFQEGKKFFNGEYPSDYVLRPGELIVTMTDLSKDGDTLGYSALVPETNRTYLHNQRIGLIEVHSNEISKDYLYWFMRTRAYQKQVVATASGSTVRHTSPSRICEIELSLPPLDVQRRIAAVLKPLDDKIELNGRINARLERVAQALFKRQFVRFEPYGGTMPPGWRVGTLGELLSVVESGSRPKGGAENSGIPSIGAENIERFGVYDYSKDKFVSESFFSSLKRGIVQSGDVLLYKDGAYTGKVSMALDSFPHERCAVNEHVFILRTKNKRFQFTLYFTLLRDKIRQRIATLAAGKAAQPGLNQNELRSVPIVIPTQDEMLKFETFAAPLMHMIAHNTDESRTLARLRDVLLPRLMSGAVDVGQVYLNSIQEGGSR